MESAKELARDARSERRRVLGLSLPAVTIITVIVFLPTLWLFGLSFVEDESFDNLDLFEEEVEVEAAEAPLQEVVPDPNRLLDRRA